MAYGAFIFTKAYPSNDSRNSKTHLELEIEIPLTRPTLDHLLESVSLLGQMGVSRVVVRMLEARSSSKERYVMLAPRLGLLSSKILNTKNNGAIFALSDVF